MYGTESGEEKHGRQRQPSGGAPQQVHSQGPPYFVVDARGDYRSHPYLLHRLWGTVSDHKGRKWSLGILAVGWAATVLLMIFISSGALGWIILIGWGVFRNSPFPVMYASIIDAVPDGASSGLGLMIGIGLGSAGFLAAPVAGFIVQHYGFTWHYIFLAVICLLTLVPISMIRETSAGQEESTVSQGA